MRKFTIILVITFSVVAAHAQDNFFEIAPEEQSGWHHKRDFSLFLSTAYLSANDPYNSSLSGGVKMRMFLGERFSFDSGFLIGKDHSQWGFGTLGLPLWMLGMEIFSDEDEDIGSELVRTLFLGIVMILSAEHIAYHIPLQNNLELSPYVSFLRMKQFSDVVSPEHPDGYTGGSSFAIGVELNTYFDQFIVSPYADYNIAYSGDFRGFNAGINVGYYLPTKRK